MLGFGVLSLVTAAIATRWIETEERIVERETLRDAHRQMDALRGELAAVRQTMQDLTSASSMMRQALLLGDAAHPPGAAASRSNLVGRFGASKRQAMRLQCEQSVKDQGFNHLVVYRQPRCDLPACPASHQCQR